MGAPSINELFKMQRDVLDRATFKKGIINAVNAQSCTADIYFAENPQTIIRNVKFSASIIPSLVRAGDQCRVDLFDETNPNDMIVAHIYGRTFKQPLTTLYSSGIGSFGAGGSNSVTIPHGLVDENGTPVLPTAYGIYVTSFPYYGPTGDTYSLILTGLDNVNMNVDRAPNNTISLSYRWWAAAFR